MPLTAHVYVAHPDLALAHTIRSVPEAELGVVSDAGTDPHHDVYFFWIEAPDFEAVEAALAEDSTVSDFAPIIDAQSRRTYRIEYSSAAKLISSPISEMGAVVVESESYQKGWRLELRLQDRSKLQTLGEYADREGIRLEVLKIQQRGTGEDDAMFGVTEPQREALLTAFLQGYYDEPREAGLEDLAELLGVSRTAVAGRLRRGSARLIEEAIVDDTSE